MTEQAQKPWHAMEPSEVLRYWEADPRRGLSGSEVEARRARLGPNKLPEPPKPSALRQFLAQFMNPLVGALLAAAVIAAGVALTESSEVSWLQRFADTIAILLIVIVNALLGFFQERRAEEALDALQKMAAPNAKVIRDGAIVILPAAALVPGDIVELEAGDQIPADVRFFETSELATEEAPLTGESTPVSKDAKRVLEEETSLGDRLNMAYMGTITVRGRGRAVVAQTGAHTELGRIGKMIREAESEKTPLEERLDLFGKQILIACLAISAFLFVLGMVLGHQTWTVLLLTAVSLAVAAIPEGLPAITTITLALGMQRMAQRGAIVRKLPAVETLGCATVICSDKTGTLTQNAMTVRLLEIAEEAMVVTGEGYSPRGEFKRNETVVATADLPVPAKHLLATAVICNSATIKYEGAETKVVGDPTEAALIVAAGKAGVKRDDLLSVAEIEKEVPFDSDRKRMSVVIRTTTGKRIAHVKGSPDVLLPLCTHVRTTEGVKELTEAERKRLLERNEEHASHALRVLAFAEREEPDEDPESKLTFLGYLAMIDPPRPEVRDAVAECHAAGIRVVMITGDHKLTAVAIAKELGFWDQDSLALTGAELAEMDDQRLQELAHRIAVFARVTAEQKLRIVRALKRRGNVVAMTGDGVNDAPALREAQIGVAMGKGGTDVAREAAEMVLADDNFATIVHAVREGRAIFRNIQKFIFFLNSSNAGLVVAVIIASFFPWMPQLTPLQLLWINLVTNGLPALALGIDPPEPGQMREQPRPMSAPLVGWRDYAGIVLVGAVMGTAALTLFWLPDWAPHFFQSANREEQLAEARSMAFTVLAISPLFHAFNCRSVHDSILRVGLFSNRFLWGAVAVSAGVHLITILVPALHPIFKTHHLDGQQWLLVLALSFLPIPVVEIGKLLGPRPPPRQVTAEAAAPQATGARAES